MISRSRIVQINSWHVALYPHTCHVQFLISLCRTSVAEMLLNELQTDLKRPVSNCVTE